MKYLLTFVIAIHLGGCGQPKAPMAPATGEANLSSPVPSKKIQQSFEVKRIQDFNLNFKAEDQALTRELKLMSKRTATTLEFKQVERQLVTVNHKQNTAFAGFEDLLLDKEFSIPSAAAAGTMQVTVNGVLVSSANYTIDNIKREVVFKTAPVSEALIKITYRANTALKTSFAVGTFVDPSTLIVKVDGTQTTAFTYDKTAGAIVFSAAPKDLAVINTQFVKDEGPILEYEIAGATEIDRVVAKSDESAVGFEFELPVLRIDPANHAHNKDVVVHYRDETSDLNEVSLPHEPLADSLTVDTKENCKLGEEIVLDGTLLKFDCRIMGSGEFKISYRYNGIENLVFVLDNPYPPDEGEWAVSIDKKPTENFSRKGNQITLNGKVAEGSVVTISFTKSASLPTP